MLLSFGNVINREFNQEIIAITKHFSTHPFFGLLDIVPAYSSITFCFDPYAIHRSIHRTTTVFDWVRQQVAEHLPVIKPVADHSNKRVEIPVCYSTELNNDLLAISSTTGLSAAEIVHLHSSGTYYVYMLGFLPGFAYMGEVVATIELPRKANPGKVKAGSVAIAGKQTGIYPLDSFGGWNVLGHTPIKMFNSLNQDPCYLKAGQEVKFYEIGLPEYRQLTT